MDRVAQENDIITVIYEGLLENGEVFDAKSADDPLTFLLGSGEVFPAFEKACIGMKMGEQKGIKVPPEAAFGKRDEGLVQNFPKSSFGDRDLQPNMVVGMNVERDGEEHQVPATVVSVEGDEVKVDFNHPLAGQTLTFKITLHDIEGALTTETGDDGGHILPNAGGPAPGSKSTN